jgi:hypothetical protein
MYRLIVLTWGTGQGTPLSTTTLRPRRPTSRLPAKAHQPARDPSSSQAQPRIKHLDWEPAPRFSASQPAPTTCDASTSAAQVAAALVPHHFGENNCLSPAIGVLYVLQASSAQAKQFSQPYLHLQTGWIPKPIAAAFSITIDDRIIAKLEAESKYSIKNRYGAHNNPKGSFLVWPSVALLCSKTKSAIPSGHFSCYLLIPCTRKIFNQKLMFGMKKCFSD